MNPGMGMGAIPADPGVRFEGGFYTGNIRVGVDLYALITAPRDRGRHEPVAWNSMNKRVEKACSFTDGAANTKAMANGGSAIAKWALALNIEGINDWYLPSRDELELIYRHFKPGARPNYYVYRNGENANSVPKGFPYSSGNPEQTTIPWFREGNAEALANEWFWSSTQYSAHLAWGQFFNEGCQDLTTKESAGWAVAVRRVKVAVERQPPDRVARPALTIPFGWPSE
jgi:hypothetical protein